MLIKCDNPVEVAKAAFWLAWNACGGTSGYGFMRDNPTATKETVWGNVSGNVATDYVLAQGEANEPYGDYVFGRMMKLGMTITADGIDVDGSTPRRDFQSWCGKYPTYESLIRAAIAEGRERGPHNEGAKAWQSHW